MKPENGSQGYNYSDNYAKPDNNIQHKDIPLQASADALKIDEGNREKLDVEDGALQPEQELVTQGEAIVKTEPKNTLKSIIEKAKEKVADIKEDILFNIENAVSAPGEIANALKETASDIVDQIKKSGETRKQEKAAYDSLSEEFAFQRARGREDLVTSAIKAIQSDKEGKYYTKGLQKRIEHPDEKKYKEYQKSIARLILYSTGRPIPGDSNGNFSRGIKSTYTESTINGFRQMANMDSERSKVSLSQHLDSIIANNQLTESDNPSGNGLFRAKAAI